MKSKAFLRERKRLRKMTLKLLMVAITMLYRHCPLQATQTLPPLWTHHPQAKQHSVLRPSSLSQMINNWRRQRNHRWARHLHNWRKIHKVNQSWEKERIERSSKILKVSIRLRNADAGSVTPIKIVLRISLLPKRHWRSSRKTVCKWSKSWNDFAQMRVSRLIWAPCSRSLAVSALLACCMPLSCSSLSWARHWETKRSRSSMRRTWSGMTSSKRHREWPRCSHNRRLWFLWILMRCKADLMSCMRAWMTPFQLLIAHWGRYRIKFKSRNCRFSSSKPKRRMTTKRTTRKIKKTKRQVASRRMSNVIRPT